jgi:hypothetical protein
VLGVGWAGTGSFRLSLPSAIVYAEIVNSSETIEAHHIASNTKMSLGLVLQSIDILSKIGLVEATDTHVYKCSGAQFIPPSTMPSNCAFAAEASLRSECKWSSSPEAYVRISFAVFKHILDSLDPVPLWSVIFAVGEQFAESQVADVVVDMHQSGLISLRNGFVFLPSCPSSSLACFPPQPVTVIPIDKASPLSQLQWTLFCRDDEAVVNSTCEVKLQHYALAGSRDYCILAPFSLLDLSRICFSVRSACSVKLSAEDAGKDNSGWTIDIASSSVKLQSDAGQFKTRMVQGEFFNDKTFTDFWISWCETGIAFGRGRVAGADVIVSADFTKAAVSVEYSKLYLYANVQQDDPLTEWLFHGISRSSGTKEQRICNAPVQLTATGIRSLLTTVLRSIEDVTGGPNSGYPFIELAAEFARSEGCVAATLLRRMMCPASSTPTPSAQTDSAELCTFCFCESSIVKFPCCATMMCGRCLIEVYVKDEQMMLKVGATPVGSSTPLSGGTAPSFGAAALKAEESLVTASAPYLKCPDLNCKGTISSSSFWKHFKRQLQLVYDHSEYADTLESIDSRFVSKAIRSLCESTSSKAPFAICDHCVPGSNTVCGSYHIADSESCMIKCRTCGRRQVLGQMKLCIAKGDAFQEDADRHADHSVVKDMLWYPNLSPASLAQWSSQQLRLKFGCQKQKLERMELDDKMLKTGVFATARARVFCVCCWHRS